jgi:DNA-binding LytR/AlgR family response regulator
MKKETIHQLDDKSNITLTANTQVEQEKKTQISFSIRAEGRIYFVLVENIAFFYLENETVYLVDFNGEKHIISKTLESLEQAVSAQQFYRINRQMLINRRAIKEIEPYVNQRVVVHLTVSTAVKALVPRLKVRPFLSWIEKG